MKPQHTPGPWRFVADGEMDDDCNIPRVEVAADYSGPGYYNNPSIEGASGTEVAGCGEYLVFGPTHDRETRAANVRLLCAAPELLTALVEIIEHRERMGLGDNEVYAKARAAIAKATSSPAR